MNKKILYIDMDGVLVNLGDEITRWFAAHPHLKDKFKNNPDHITGLFRFPKPNKGALSAIKKLYDSGKYDMFISTSSPWGNPEALTDKRYWLEYYFGEMFHKKLITTHRKDLLIGDYLIDDRLKNGAGEFKGKLLRFGYDWENNNSPNEYPDWNSVLNYLL